MQMCQKFGKIQYCFRTPNFKCVGITTSSIYLKNSQLLPAAFLFDILASSLVMCQKYSKI